MQKKSKNWLPSKIFFSLETTQNALKFVRNTICAVHEKFQARISQKRSWSFFKKSVTPDMQKKFKKIVNVPNFFKKIFEKNFLRSKQPRDALKFVRNTICAVHEKFQARISQKSSCLRSISFFKKSVTPDMQKKSKNSPIFEKKFFSLETTLNALKFVRNTICAVHDKFQAGISQKRSWSFFKKSVTPDMQKKSKNFQFLKKFFFARNNLKCLKIRSQHHLCSPRQISGRYLSKKKLVIFQEICDPGYAKKVKKLAIFEKNDLKRLKIRSQHHLCSPRQISGPYLSKQSKAP